MDMQYGLFSDPSSGKSARQQQFEDLYVSTGIDIVPIIRDAHRKVLTEAATQSPEFVDKLFWAHGMNRNMVGFLTQRYPDMVHHDEANRVYIKLGEQARIYFKKLDDKFRPRNIPTGHVIDLNSAQGQLFGREMTVLYVGPRLKQKNLWDEIDCFMVEMRNNTRCEWVSDLSDLSSSMGRGFSVVPPPVTPSAPPAIAVRLKNKDLGKEAGNDKTGTL
jgi:hypothetical protein